MWKRAEKRVVQRVTFSDVVNCLRNDKKGNKRFFGMDSSLGAWLVFSRMRRILTGYFHFLCSPEGLQKIFGMGKRTE